MLATSLRWKLLLGLTAVLIIAAAAYAKFMMPSLPSGLDLSRSKGTEHGLYVGTIEPSASPVSIGQMHAWIIQVESADGRPVTDASVSIDGGMPQHGHGLPTQPRMTKVLAAGRYLIEGVKFNMGGWWTLKFEISAPAGKDTVTFNLVL
jgi:hypothetical protein